MKKLIFLSIIVANINNIGAMEIEGVTKKQIMQELDNTVMLSALNKTLGAKYSYPKKIGNKEILLSQALNFSDEGRDILNAITEPSCWNQMHGYGPNVLTDDQITKVNKNMPPGFMNGTKVKRDATYNPFSDKGITDMCTNKDITGMGMCAVVPSSGCIAGLLLLCAGSCASKSSNAIIVGNAPGVIQAGAWTTGASCACCSLLALVGLVYPCVCREQEDYTFN